MPRSTSARSASRSTPRAGRLPEAAGVTERLLLLLAVVAVVAVALLVVRAVVAARTARRRLHHPEAGARHAGGPAGQRRARRQRAGARAGLLGRRPDDPLDRDRRSHPPAARRQPRLQASRRALGAA